MYTDITSYFVLIHVCIGDDVSKLWNLCQSYPIVYYWKTKYI